MEKQYGKKKRGAIGNVLGNTLRTRCNHLGNTLGTNKQEIPPPPPPTIQMKK